MNIKTSEVNKCTFDEYCVMFIVINLNHGSSD